MYKEPLAPDKVNRNMAMRIEEKIIKQVDKLSNPEKLDDLDFTVTLYDLCVLNRMRESQR